MDDTPALRALAAMGIAHEVTRTSRSGSVEEAAEKRGVAVSALLKTLVVRRAEDDYLFVLVPGDRGIDWAKLRGYLGVRRISLPDAAEALEVTGYERGTITPYGATKAWPVVADASIPADGLVSIGGGHHGVSVKIAARDLIASLHAAVADVTKLLESD